MKRWTIVLVIAVGALGAGCANDDPGPTAARSPAPIVAPSATPTWAGYPEPKGKLGDISVTEFNEFVEQANPPWKSSPIRAALEFIQGGPPRQEAPPFRTTVIQEASPELGTEASVTLTSEGLGDDSVAAVRFRLEFQREDDGAWRLVSAFMDQRCARGPDTESFTTEPCL